MRHAIVLSLLVMIVCESSLVSQSRASQDIALGNPVLPDSAERNKYNFSQFGHETWSFIKQPTTWDGSDWLTLGAIGAGTFLLMQVDQPIRDEATKDQRYLLSFPIEAGRMWAELPPPVLIFTGLAVFSWITGDRATRKTAYEVAQALLYAGAADKLLAIVVGRSRPYVNEGPKSYHLFSSVFPIPEHQSLPGGHNVIAFALSTALSRNVKPLWLKGLAYVPAALTFVSRVYQDRHWTSDNFLGASLGFFVATWVVDQHEQVEQRIQVSSIFPLTISIALN